jgi:hypothetical protein
MASLHERYIINLLRGPVVGRIRFTFPEGGGKFTIDSGMYRRVADAIERGSIGVVPTTDPRLIPPEAGATYFDHWVPGGMIYIRPGYFGRSLEGDVVHECTHAAFDLDMLKGLTALTEEAAAYVAETLYYRMTNISQARWGSVIRDVAVPVAERLLREYQAGNTPIPAVDPVVFHTLRAVIPLRPAYLGRAASNGGSYLHNG